MKVYIERSQINVEAVGEYDAESGKLTVLKGSKISSDVAHSPKFRGASSIENKRKDTVKNNRTIVDVEFKSPSTASNYVTGRSTNGYILWKDSEGRTLKEILGR